MSLDIPSWSRMAVFVHFHLKLHPALRGAREEGGSVWVDGDEDEISALLVISGGTIEVGLQKSEWWESDVREPEHARRLADQLAGLLQAEWEKMRG